MAKSNEYKTTNVSELEQRLFGFICCSDMEKVNMELTRISKRSDFSILVQYNYACETFIFCVQNNSFDAVKLIASIVPSYKLMSYFSKKTGQDAMSTAIAAHHNHILLWLLQLKYYNINQRDIMGRTAFFKAVLWGKFAAARTLMKHNCDVYSCNDQMKSIFDFVNDLNQNQFVGASLDVPYKIDLSGINKFLVLVLHNKA